MNGSNNSIPTIKEIAQKLKCSRRTLSRHFPDLCSRIVNKRRAIEKTNHNRKIEKCCQEVRQTTISLYEQGQYPHEANVSKLISHPGFFRYKKVRNTLKEVKRELGLEP